MKCGLNEIGQDSSEFVRLKLYLLERIIRDKQIVPSYHRVLEEIFLIYIKNPSIISDTN